MTPFMSLFVFALSVDLSFGHGEGCAVKSFPTNVSFVDCRGVVAGDFAAEKLAYIPKNFDSTTQSLLYADFTSAAFDVAMCGCSFAYDATTVFSSPDPHLNFAVASAYLRDAPKVKFIYGAGATNSPPKPGNYVFVMADATASSPNSSPTKPGLNWLVYNFDGSDLSSGMVALPYSRPLPTKSIGTHQYLYLLYQQNSTIQNLDLGEYTSGCSSCMFDIQMFVSENNLVLVGGNWQLASYDNSVAKARIDAGQEVNCNSDLTIPCSAAGTVFAAWQLATVLLACLIFA